MSSSSRAIWIKRNGEWVPIEQPSIKVNDAWTSVEKGFYKEGNEWKQFYPSSGTVEYTTPGTYTFKVPPGIRSLTIDLQGAGGGGGGSSEVGSGGGGGGGGSGGYLLGQTVTVTPGETLTIRVGEGGRGAPFVGRTTVAPGGAEGSGSSVSGPSVDLYVSGGAGGGGGTGDGGGGGGGGSIICTRLHALGYLSDSIYEADEKFGEYLRATDPDTYYGYLKWASTVLDWIDGSGPDFMFWIQDKEIRQQRQSELVTRWTVRIATPWAKHMAHTMGAEEKDSRAGKLIMRAGTFISRMIGKHSKSTKPSTSRTAGYALWAIFGIFWLLAGIK